jgi:type VI secretion system protein ImpJ
MTWNSKVIWTEGMFLRPIHFQQQERHFQSLLESRCGGIQCYAWGLIQLEIDQGLLALGKFAVTSCQGVFPDGTPFSMPDHHPLPMPLDISSDIKNQIIYLTLPVNRMTAKELNWGEQSDELSRYQLQEIEVKDIHSPSGQETATIQSGALWTRLRLAALNQDAFVTIAIAKIIHKTGQLVVLDDQFIPTGLQVGASNQLTDFVKEIEGKLHHQGLEVAQHLGAPGAGGVAEIEDFLLLQIVNRYEPLFTHFASLKQLHPEQLFRILIQMVGELATMTQTGYRPKNLPIYHHENLTNSFVPVMIALREALAWRPERRAVAIPLEERPHQIRLAIIHDGELLQSAEFILAAHAQIPTDKLRSQLPRHLTIAPVEKLKNLVMSAVPGIRLSALSVAPRQIPFHKGMTYFVLDKNHVLWQELEKSGTIAMHFSSADEYPRLELEFWAIRGE